MSGEPSIELRRGDTFKARGLYRGEDGALVNLPTSGITIRAFMRRDDHLVEMPVTYEAELGRFTIRGDTSAWPIGYVHWYLQYQTADGDRSSSPFYKVMVYDGVN